MISKKIKALFDFIDFLDDNKREYIRKYIPLCHELEDIFDQKNKLDPNKNYKEKLEYDKLQFQIKEKFSLINSDIYLPIINKLLELEIWSGDEAYSSIWNNNVSEIYKLKENFNSEDVNQILEYKEKYLKFRNETNSNFLSLELIFHSLDSILKILFDFFKDTSENEFENFETKTIKANSFSEAIKDYLNNKEGNKSYSISFENFFNTPEKNIFPTHSSIKKNEIIMGDKFTFGDIKNNTGKINIGRNIQISKSKINKKESISKIEELIELLGLEQNFENEKRQSLIKSFGKIKEEILEETPNTSKIYKWLSNTKSTLESLVLTKDTTEIIKWIYENLNFS